MAKAVLMNCRTKKRALLRAPVLRRDDNGHPAPVAEADAAVPAAADVPADPAAAPVADADADVATVLGDASPAAADVDAGADAAADGDAAAVEGPPEAYDLAVDGMDIDGEMLAAADPVLRELGLSNDNARKLVPLAAQMVERAGDAALQHIVAEGNAQRKAWLDAAQADADIGGANWDGSIHLAAKGLDALGFVKGDPAKNIEGHPFRQALEATGFGNHPDMIRVFKFIGEQLGEDGEFVRADASTAAKTDVVTRLYGK
jgi:hypothetical protein